MSDSDTWFFITIYLAVFSTIIVVASFIVLIRTYSFLISPHRTYRVPHVIVPVASKRNA